MDECNHLVADAFNAVLALPAVEKRRALAWFEGDDACVLEARLDVVAGGERAGAAWSADEGGNLAVAHVCRGLFDGVAGDEAVEAVVGHQFELGEDDVLLRLADIFVVRTLQGEDDVGFSAGREVEIAAVFADAFVAFLAHGVGHDDDGRVAFQGADIGGTDAEVACAGPDDAAVAWTQVVEGFGFGQGGVGGTDLH